MASLSKICRARPEDAQGIVDVLQTVAAERIHSAIDQVWTVEDERRYIEALSAREAIHVAVDERGGIVGLQVLDRWSPTLDSMAHVGQVGTFLLPDWRRLGIGGQLWSATRAFASEAHYRKIVIYVRGSNTSAQRFYQHLGFQFAGRLARQVLIDGVEDDEVIMEVFL
jgi:ribosomal protein S18 acetylase RimI-like enzyme